LGFFCFVSVAVTSLLASQINDEGTSEEKGPAGSGRAVVIFSVALFLGTLAKY
jgi:hypothetical protein